MPTDKSLEIQKPILIDIDFDSIGEDYISIPVFDNIKEERPRKYNRAKAKKEFEEIIEEELYGEDDLER